MSIDAIACVLNVHQRTLRIWDKEKILKPHRTDKNRRMYSIQDIQKGEFILFLTRNLALNLASVKIILALLAQNNIKPEEYINYIDEAAKTANIDNEVQKDNIYKTKKRGRPKKD